MENTELREKDIQIYTLLQFNVDNLPKFRLGQSVVDWIITLYLKI